MTSSYEVHDKGDPFKSGDIGQPWPVWTSDVIGDHYISFTMHLALRSDLSCGVTSCQATAQLCSPTISPKVVGDFLIPALSIIN